MVILMTPQVVILITVYTDWQSYIRKLPLKDMQRASPAYHAKAAAKLSLASSSDDADKKSNTATSFLSKIN